jgi:hypothetical protein
LNGRNLGIQSKSLKKLTFTNGRFKPSWFGGGSGGGGDSGDHV